MFSQTGGVFSHAHVADLYKRPLRLSESSEYQPMLIGNTGTLIQTNEPPSCLTVDPATKGMQLFRYDKKAESMLLWKEESLAGGGMKSREE